MQQTICNEAVAAVAELCETAKLTAGDLLVIGCSSSEIGGKKIGTQGSVALAQELFAVIAAELSKRGILLAAQCCEHLNRALIVERETARRYHLELVNVIPHPKAGGAFATAAYQGFADAVAVESLRAQAHAGMDIGRTLIGMHLRPVAVPVRLSVEKIGEAAIICARTRPKFVGGVRAQYDERLL